MPIRRCLAFTLLLLASAHCGEGGETAVTPEPGDGDAQWERWSASEAEWGEMVAVEQTIRALEPGLQLLGNEVKDLALPGPRSRDLFTPVVAVRDLDAAGGRLSPGVLEPHLGEAVSWGPAPGVAEVSAAALDLWQPLWSQLAWLEHARFKLVRGRFEGDAQDAFRGEVRLVASARRADGSHTSLRVDAELRWLREWEGEEPRWRIAAFETRGAQELRSAGPVFEDVLDRAVRDESEWQRARTSLHEERVRQWLGQPETAELPEHFFAPAMDRHPGLAVVDVDRDGFDDLYVMARWGRNQLLYNRGDGTFEEQAAEWGLDIDGHSSSAVFADFDNDGDPDVFVGRTLAPSVYLENREGRFHPSDHPTLPYLVSSVNAVDFDGDGLLDVYVSTYAARLAGSARAAEILAPYLPPADLARLVAARESADQDRTLRLAGPPNVMLRNLGGGRFARFESESLGALMNTYQAAWADYDNDGDPDVYLSHDFGPNQLLRNEGDGRFSDVTAETGTADIGFGMGASWGDYDEDGRPDLYVSNMYSTAGRRITEGFADLDPRYAKMARGNTLFRNEGTFRHVSGLEPPALMVEAAGWAWGGQFADFDADGDLDIVVLSGYYSAPPEFAVPVDT